MVKQFLKKNLTPELFEKVRRLVAPVIIRVNDVRSIGLDDNLDKLGKIYESDKIGRHFYTTHYQLHFNRFRNSEIKLLEIGAGGYENPKLGGNSLRMWKKYFPSGQIYSIDIYDKSSLQENRIKIFKGSQIDKDFLESVTQETGPLDIIIDDGSHINEHVIETFRLLFPKLKEGGIYAVEDTQTSYWPGKYGGDSYNLEKPDTIMNFFKRLTDSLNYMEFKNPSYQPTYYDMNIISIHFYHNLIFIYKGKNNK